MSRAGIVGESSFILAIGIALALFLLAGGYQVWMRMAVRTRPWHLEACLDSCLAECRTAPGAFNFHRNYKQLAARANEANGCLFIEDRKWWFRRDYSVCMSKLLAVYQDVQLLKLRLAERRQEQKAKSLALLGALKHELDSRSQNNKLWAKFDLRNIEKSRARTLAEQAEYLSDRGEDASALETALRAWIAWQRFIDEGDVEFARFENSSLREKWDEQAERLLRWTKESGRPALLVDKLDHSCLLLRRGQIEKSYAVELGRFWYRRKLQAQDASTPEGEYKVQWMKPSGRYGYTLMLNYPNAEDRARFQSLRRDGAIASGARIGGNIEIHGGERHDTDWTDGCVSLNNGDMRELYLRAYSGMPVIIVGTTKITSTMRDEEGAARR